MPKCVSVPAAGQHDDAAAPADAAGARRRARDAGLLTDSGLISWCVLAFPPHEPRAGRRLQLAAAASAAARDAVRKGALPDGWALRPCVAEHSRRPCARAGGDVVVTEHALLPPGDAEPVRLASMHFSPPLDAHPRFLLLQSVAFLGGGAALHYPRVVALVAELFVAPPRPAARRRAAAVLGVGGAVIVRGLAAQRWDVAAVDLSAEVIAAARGHFGAPGSAQYATGDAIEFLRDWGGGAFDAVICDLFTTSGGVGDDALAEVAALAAARLRADGVFIANLHRTAAAQLRAILRPFGAAGAAWLVPVPLDAGGAVLVASKRGLPRDWRAAVTAAAPRLPPPLRSVAAEYTDRPDSFPGYHSIGRVLACRDARTAAVGDHTVIVLPGMAGGRGPRASDASSDSAATRRKRPRSSG